MALRLSARLMQRRNVDAVATTAARVVGSRKTDKIMQKIEAEMADETKRLFAVVYINGRQFKVGENDLITLQDNLPLDVGDKIKLEKVLLLGGQSFTLIGRPLLQSPSVRVNATVVEKTTQAPELKYTMVNHKSIRKLLWMSRELTVLRINEITIDK
ncbi:39S ribosomal protein L21, mitochondrial [Toxocara canis]|uniref:Large ribosomal subunit protein bL21m n=1 Tax=Toxocara canis TaxID=6265 RepID=A0A0B2VWL3_TOXCA|nr:39S ribosomal protein L21, mitochondrial [Toxocara canis]